MMMGESEHPPWPSLNEFPLSGSDGDCSPYLLTDTVLPALRRYLPSNEAFFGDDDGDEVELVDSPVDAYSCDKFRMYEFKVRRCARGRSHDWTECPYAHPGEKARRRDPRKYHYSGTACPDFRKGGCKRGDACEFAHGVFECWLHPARYRTQPCKDGTSCRRRVCFFAHTPEQLRVLPQSQQSPKAPVESYDGSPLRNLVMFSSPTSTLISAPISPPSDSPPLSPGAQSVRRASVPMNAPINEVLASLRHLQLSKVKSLPKGWGLPLGCGILSPRASGVMAGVGVCNTGLFSSLPATPTMSNTPAVVPAADCQNRWDLDDEPVERVESGRAFREKMMERLNNEYGLDRADFGGPDVGSVSELVK